MKGYNNRVEKMRSQKCDRKNVFTKMYSQTVCLKNVITNIVTIL